jgi:hypothetical protein
MHAAERLQTNDSPAPNAKGPVAQETKLVMALECGMTASSSKAEAGQLRVAPAADRLGAATSANGNALLTETAPAPEAQGTSLVRDSSLVLALECSLAATMVLGQRPEVREERTMALRLKLHPDPVAEEEVRNSAWIQAAKAKIAQRAAALKR